MKEKIGGLKTANKTATKAAPAPLQTTSDDLTKIEGIGPKISQLLQDDGINTFADLAGTSPDAIRDILSAAGGQFASHDPETWPAQAEMARDGKWDELRKWQDELDGGRE
ncbi:MAG: helix-hairpin-helix domain-containing protein [Gammaproteobacteria bacterium]